MFENDGETGHFINNTFDPTLCFLCVSLSLSRETRASLGARGECTKCQSDVPLPAQGGSATHCCTFDTWVIHSLYHCTMKSFMKHMLMYIGNGMQKQDAEEGNTSKKQAFIFWPPNVTMCDCWGKNPQKTAMCTFTKCIFNNILTARVLMVNNVLCSSTQCYTQMSNVQMFILCINPALHPSLNPEDHTNLRV